MIIFAAVQFRSETHLDRLYGVEVNYLYSKNMRETVLIVSGSTG
jgi:hypothetical protein